MLGDRKPFSKFAIEIFLKRMRKETEIYISGNSVTTIYYILCKNNDEIKVRFLISELFDLCHIIPATKDILKAALESNFKDFEDAVQHFSALTNNKIKAIVTRNVRDYIKSKIEVLSPEDFLLKKN
jgi:hypothetical protein